MSQPPQPPPLDVRIKREVQVDQATANSPRLSYDSIFERTQRLLYLVDGRHGHQTIYMVLFHMSSKCFVTLSVHSTLHMYHQHATAHYTGWQKLLVLFFERAIFISIFREQEKNNSTVQSIRHMGLYSKQWHMLLVCPFLHNMEDQISYPYNRTGKITVLYTVIFMFINTTGKDKITDRSVITIP